MLGKGRGGALTFILGHFATANHEFYSALIAVDVLERAAQGVNPDLIEKIKRRQRQLQQWANSCPENFLHKSLLLSAEIARLEGEGWQAAELYDRAIEEAGRSGYLQEEALARERAGLFWLEPKPTEDRFCVFQRSPSRVSTLGGPEEGSSAPTGAGRLYR